MTSFLFFIWLVFLIPQVAGLVFLSSTNVADKTAKLLAMSFNSIQLVGYLVWAILYFGLKIPILSLALIGLVDIAAIFSLIATYRIYRNITFLILPLLFWLGFITWLNFQSML